MDRRRVSSSIAGLLIAVVIFWFFTCQNAPQRTRKGAAPPHAEKDRDSRREGSGAKEHEKLTPIPVSPAAASSKKACRELLAKAVLAKHMRPGFSAWSLGHFHRNNAEFRAVGDAFCKQAGDELVPICKDLLGECGSEATASLVAAILGHSKRGEAFGLLKGLVEKGKGPPESRELHAGAIYSIGMIRAPESAPFLFKLFRESPEARVNIGEKFGTPLMASIGMCGKEGVALLREAALAGLSPEMLPDTDEGLRPFRWGYVSLVNSPEAFGELKSIARQDADIRIRGMAIAAMGQSSDPEQRAYLAELYGSDDNPLIRRAILEALNDGASDGREEWSTMRDRMAAPLASILNATRLPSGNEYVDYATIHLACAAGTPDAAKYLEEWIRTASSGAYDAESYWIDIAIHALATQGASVDRIDALMEGQGVYAQNRLFHLATVQFYSAAPIGGMKLAREFIAHLDKSDEINGLFLNCLQAVGRVPEAREEAEKCIDRFLERAKDPEKWRTYFSAAQYAGEAGLRPLEKVILRVQEPSELLGASHAYLSALPEGRALNADVSDRMRELFSPRALQSFNAGGLSQNPGSFARTIGEYFGRFGTVEDLAWLESLPRVMNEPRNVREDHLETLRRDLAWECARAADAIRLRSN
ncbi:MAG TPA: HEAT repeat domain-containing protein [Planctomycetota bacterium]|nr:HEAT repeat domain-containing protein [Planctomycetota bacterium]